MVVGGQKLQMPVAAKRHRRRKTKRTLTWYRICHLCLLRSFAAIDFVSLQQSLSKRKSLYRIATGTGQEMVAGRE
jgi:hypothetical protein